MSQSSRILVAAVLIPLLVVTVNTTADDGPSVSVQKNTRQDIEAALSLVDNELNLMRGNTTEEYPRIEAVTEPVLSPPLPELSVSAAAIPNPADITAEITADAQERVDAIEDELDTISGGAEATAAPDLVITPPSPAPVMAQPMAQLAPFRLASSPDYKGNPLSQPLTFSFRNMELSNVVDILATMADINIVTGEDLSGRTVTVNFEEVPLKNAMDVVLRLSGLGIVEDAGIYRIVSLAEANVANQVTRVIFLQNGKADQVKLALDTLIIGAADEQKLTIGSDPVSNAIILAGLPKRVREFEGLIEKLDVADPPLPTDTKAIKLNYADPVGIQTVIKGMLTKDVGTVEVDARSRHVIVTDTPGVIAQVEAMVKTVDLPIKQVSIEAMVIDAVLKDSSATGVTWIMDSIRRISGNGQNIGNLTQATATSTLGLGFDPATGLGIAPPSLDASVFSFGFLSSDFDIRGAIAAEVATSNAQILANPSLVTVENATANINIVQDFPYQELTQTTNGPPVATTEFKPIGVQLTVTPRITHEDDIITKITVKQSSVSGVTESGVPVEDRRDATTELRVPDGRTVFIGGLRDISDRTEMSKIPILGDIPVMNFMFRNNSVEKTHTELLVFLTCNVVREDLPELSPNEQGEYDKLGAVPQVPDAQRAMFHGIVNPEEMRDPAWKWRRTK